MKRWLIILLIAASVAPATLAGALLDCTRSTCPPTCCSRIDADDGATSKIDSQREPCGCSCGLNQGTIPRSPDAELATLLAPSSGSEVGLVLEGLPEASIPPLQAFGGREETGLRSASHDTPVYLLFCSFLS